MNLDRFCISQPDLAEFCRRNHVRKLAIFGSALTDRFKDTSDVDILVEFEPNFRVGYLRMAAMERELSALFRGRTIDLRTAPELSRYFRDEVLRTASVQYANPFSQDRGWDQRLCALVPSPLDAPLRELANI